MLLVCVAEETCTHVQLAGKTRLLLLTSGATEETSTLPPTTLGVPFLLATRMRKRTGVVRTMPRAFVIRAF